MILLSQLLVVSVRIAQAHDHIGCASSIGESPSQRNLDQLRMEALVQRDENHRQLLLVPSCNDLCQQCVTIDVHFHLGMLQTGNQLVVPHPPEAYERWLNGRSSDFTPLFDMYRLIENNMENLNQRFTDSPFQFQWKNKNDANLLVANEWVEHDFVEWVIGDDLYRNSIGTQVYVDDPKVLNVYLVHESCVQDDGVEFCQLLGGAILPNIQRSNKVGGMVMIYSTLLGGGYPQRDGGVTLAHEVGHWLGLLHTFHSSTSFLDTSEPVPCDPYDDSDFVTDTPVQAQPSASLYQCSRNFYQDQALPDSCPNLEGSDPVFNYMNYIDDDACIPNGIGEFTCGQYERMWAQWLLYREHAEECAPNEIKVGIRIDAVEDNFWAFFSFYLESDDVVVYNSTSDHPVIVLEESVLEVDLCLPDRSYTFVMMDVLEIGFNRGGSYEVLVNGVLIERVTGAFGARSETRFGTPTTSSPTATSSPASDTPSSPVQVDTAPSPGQVDIAPNDPPSSAGGKDWTRFVLLLVSLVWFLT